ncbi:uncharacterized protein LOC110065842 isoform X3 [Orbicella faveolata]|uniref:uncharacterized protein LOC110065842 isoform X3 n=1 Tax=Orbicella faveolata TaxID=48498 RepID=UPI0009E2C27B|nr:uncharacterized protein LOC110065842 isoform X3 [Orbicella faveolata]
MSIKVFKANIYAIPCSEEKIHFCRKGKKCRVAVLIFERYGIANHPDSVQAVEGFDAFPGHGNTPYKSAQSSAEYPWLRTYGLQTKRESISQGDQRKSYITTDKAGGVRDPLTKRNQIRKATRRYQRK